MLNKIVIMGRLVRDPELRHTQKDTAVSPFTLAVDRDITDSNGNRRTDFIDCIAWAGTAEFVCKHFTKGSMAVVVGRLQFRDWTDKEGNKRRNAEVLVENIYFGEAKRRDDRYDEDGSKYGHEKFNELPEDDGDLPF